MKPLLVVLHGDNGELHVKKLARGFKAACDAHDLVCIFPVCPRCPHGSFWQWKQSSEHDPNWLAAQIAQVPDVDPARVYAAGYSGGATYLGWYGPTHPKQFAAIAYVSGGMPWGDACPLCKYPVRFDLGAGDPMLTPFTKPLRDFYEQCGGHEIVWETLRGVSHEGMLDVLPAGRAEVIVTWLLQHENHCLTVPDAGAPTAPASASASASAPAPAPAPASSPSPVQVAPHGCGCGIANSPDPAPFLLFAVATTLVWKRWTAATRRRARSARSISTARRTAKTSRSASTRRAS